MPNTKILVTGGAGYIGSHTAVELLENGYDVFIVDNFSNSNPESLRRIEAITGRRIGFAEADLQDQDALDQLFATNSFDAVIHFAGLKAVGESVSNALLYYRNNLESTLALLEVMARHDVKQLVFSSSATVYGDPEFLPLTESAARRPTNPYGHTKLMNEQILEDMCATNQDWSITSLRYFNPVGAHESGLIGEDPNGVPNNLLPYVAQVASGKLDVVRVFGGDYDTPDGTGRRDYIHITDLARAHVAAVQRLDHPNIYKAYNVGTGISTSVLELIRAFEAASGVEIPYIIADRRPGDIATCFADPTLGNDELGWTARHSIAAACASTWKWQHQNPNGFRPESR